MPKGTTYQPTSPFMKEELRKLDEITVQVDYLTKKRIEMLDNLLSARESLQNEMDTLTEQWKQLQTKICRASLAAKERLQDEKQTVTPKIPIAAKNRN